MAFKLLYDPLSSLFSNLFSTPTTYIDADNKPLNFMRDAGLKQENYSTIIFSYLPIDLKADYLKEPPGRSGVQIIFADEKDFGKEIVEEFKGDDIFKKMYQKKFLVPFLHLHQHCPQCLTKLSYVSGSHQYLDEQSYLLHDSDGWLHTKNQYFCSTCGQYITFVDRTFVFVNTGYNLLYTYRLPYTTHEHTHIVDSESKVRRPEPKYELFSEKEKIYKLFTWKGKCILCETETIPLPKDNIHNFIKSICPKDNFIHCAK